MRAAPQVLYPLGRPRLQQTLLALLLLSTLSLIVAVALQQPGYHLVAAMGLMLVPAGWLAWRAQPGADSQLFWDGECWHLLGPQPISGQLHLALDLQRALLLRWVSPCFESGPDSRWLWIEQGANPVIWKDVRRAVYWNAR